MRKQILAILIAIGMCYAFAPMVGAGTTDTITVTLTPGGAADIIVYNTTGWVATATWHPVVSIGGHLNTTGGAYTINNTGSIAVDVVINATLSGGAWTIVTGTTPAHDQVCLRYNKTVLGTWTNILDQAGAAFLDDFPANGQTGDNASFDLGVYMPTSTSTNAAQTVTILFTATPV